MSVETRASAPVSISAFGPVAQIDAGELNVGYVELGPTSGPAVLLLHGWPYDIHSFAESASILASEGHRVIVPHVRGHGSTRFRSDGSMRNAQQAALAADAVALLDALGIGEAVVAGFDWGARTADIVAALWPERCRGLVSVSGYLIGSQEVNKSPLPPAAELAWWYQFYFATDRGAAGYEKYRREFARLIWQTASPQWNFDDATFERSADSLDNPDHVAIVIHNYRWRLGLAAGDPALDAMEDRLAQRPRIDVAAISMEGDANGAPHPAAESYREAFAGPYEHRVVSGGVGHNLPQEAPPAFAQAVIDVGRL
jgi:pimeloyl-ACP methyl ester carboxylesterase